MVELPIRVAKAEFSQHRPLHRGAIAYVAFDGQQHADSLCPSPQQQRVEDPHKCSQQTTNKPKAENANCYRRWDKACSDAGRAKH